MESLIVLAALFFIGGPILLFCLVLGARSRVTALETEIVSLRNSLNRLRTQLEQLLAKAAENPAAAVPAPEKAPAREPAAAARIEPRPAATSIEPMPAPSYTPLKPAPQPAPSAPLAEPVFSAPPVAANPYTPPAAGEAPRATPKPVPPAKPPQPPQPPAWLLKAKEWLFGGNLVAKAGLLILFFGVSFLLKYAAARVTVPIELRLAGITLADIGLLLWGWRIRHSRPSISLPVQGAAMGIMMLVTFAAFRMYNLIPGGLAFAILFALTFFTCLLAVLQNAVWLAVFGIAGGFAAPILTSTGHGSHIGLFSYYALLNAGILGIALKRSWRLLNLLGFAFTFLIGTTWGVTRYVPENFASVQGFLILFFLFYVAIAILYASREAPRLKHYVDGTLVFGTPLLGFGLQYGIVHDKPFGLAFSALALGLFYIVLTLALWQRRGSSLRLLVESFLALGIVFGTLAIPFALDGRWTSAAWALEGACIVWVGLRQKQTLAWVFGVLVQVGAWISFIAGISGLEPGTAAKSNLWLGFLLLAGTGLAMAMNFRKQVNQEEGDTPRIVTVLATIFLGFASLWLLAGAWTEIFLHVHGHHQGTLLALSAVFVAGILGLIASRLDWGIARYFALVPQAAAGIVFIALTFSRFSNYAPRNHGNLFDSYFLGALLIALAAGFSSLMFHRQPEGARRGLSRMLLVWSALWWFVLVLTNLADWGEWMLADTALASSHDGLFTGIYAVLVAAGGIVFARLATRLDWGDLRWPAAAVWPGLLVAMLSMFNTLTGYGLRLPALPTWIGFAALWLCSEWLLANGRRQGWLTPEQRPRILRLLHTLRTAGPWLLLWPLGHHLVALGLQIDSAREAALLADAGWFTAGSWPRYLPAWAMMAVVALLMPRVRGDAWPVTPVADWYRRVLIPLGALWAVALAVLWNFTQNGRMEPLPYLPLLNPLDLTTGFAALLSITAWRLYAAPDKRPLPDKLPWLAGGLAYVWFNLMLLRTAAQYVGISYQFEPLFSSQFVQAMLSLVWSATALVLMRLAARRSLRALWIAGAVLLGLVVAKLFFVDLSNVGGIERIISFLGVGALMLAIGYLAPFPTDKSSAANAANATEPT